MEQQPNKIVKGLKIAVSVIFYIIIAALLIFSVSTLTKKKADQIPNFFGIGFLAVHEEADSMKGKNKDSFNPGDLVFVKVLNDKQKDKLDLQKLADDGTVVSFYDYILKDINTHRVVGYGVLSNGKEYVETQGDNKSEPDDMKLERDDILAIYQGKAKGLGKPIGFMQTQMGFALVVIVPMLLLLFWQGYVLVKNIYVAKTESLKETLELEKEEEREKLKQELLEEMQREKEDKQEE